MRQMQKGLPLAPRPSHQGFVCRMGAWSRRTLGESSNGVRLSSPYLTVIHRHLSMNEMDNSRGSTLTSCVK